jgi:hypothetical protein
MAASTRACACTCTCSSLPVACEATANTQNKRCVFILSTDMQGGRSTGGRQAERHNTNTHVRAQSPATHHSHARPYHGTLPQAARMPHCAPDAAQHTGGQCPTCAATGSSLQPHEHTKAGLPARASRHAHTGLAAFKANRQKRICLRQRLVAHAQMGRLSCKTQPQHSTTDDDHIAHNKAAPETDQTCIPRHDIDSSSDLE